VKVFQKAVVLQILEKTLQQHSLFKVNYGFKLPVILLVRNSSPSLFSILLSNFEYYHCCVILSKCSECQFGHGLCIVGCTVV
jgi:hypothetical protein